MKLIELECLPDGLLALNSDQLTSVLSGPTLVHLEGKETAPLFISVLQHGNEPAGWEAVKKLLKLYESKLLPRSISLFLGNIEAARYAQRHLPGGQDYNRCWPGGGAGRSELRTLLAEVTSRMRQLKPFASIDIHNNTGKNPHYAAINTFDPQSCFLASEFSQTVIYFTQPSGVQSMAFADFCPSLTLECGQAGDLWGVKHAFDFIDYCLKLTAIPGLSKNQHAMDLYKMIATVTVNKNVGFSVGDAVAELCFPENLDRYNFKALPVGTKFATIGDLKIPALSVIDDHGNELNDQYFTAKNGELRTIRPVFPSMLTVNKQVIRQDCLCYFMEKIKLSAA